MVRGFGMTLGRKAANAVTRPSATGQAQRKLSEKKEKYYTQLLGFKQEYVQHEKNVEDLYANNKITQWEYMDLKGKLATNIENVESEIAKLEELKNTPKSYVGWILLAIIAIPVLIGMFS